MMGISRTIGQWTCCLALAVAMLGGALGCESNLDIRTRGDRAMFEQDYLTAREHYARAVQRQPTDFLAQYSLGEVSLKLDEPRDARMAFQQALALRPSDPEWRPRLLDMIAESIYQQGRHDDLYVFLDQTTRTQATTRDYLRQGEYLMRVDDVDSARGAFIKAVQFAGEGEVEPYIAIADFFESVNDKRNAVLALSYAYYISPGHAEVESRLRRLNVTPGPTIALQPPATDHFQ